MINIAKVKFSNLSIIFPKEGLLQLLCLNVKVIKFEFFMFFDTQKYHKTLEKYQKRSQLVKVEMHVKGETCVKSILVLPVINQIEKRKQNRIK